jgi:methyl-accepting chemotaxis protein
LENLTVLNKLNDLKLVQKVGLLPLTGGLGFLLILVVSLGLGLRSASRLGEIENGYVPSLELSRDMEDLLAELQRSMQDAVASADPTILDETAALRDAFRARVEVSRQTATNDSTRLETIANGFEEYYGTAYAASSRMIAGETGDAVVTALQTMTQEYNDIRDAIARGVEDDQTALSDGFAAARTAQRVVIVTITVVTVLGIALLIAITVVILRTVMASLLEFSRGFTRMRAGNFRTKLEIRTKDEIGDLSHQANEMMEELGQLIGAVIRTAETVAEAAEEMSASAAQLQQGAETQSSSSEQTSSAMVEMATQIDQVARAATDLAANVDETAASIQEMGSTSGRVASDSESLASAVHETASTIEQMAASVESIAQKVRVVEEVSRAASDTVSSRGQELSKVIRGIGTSSKDIGKIIGIIEEIADQTNLLALNAAIEAARAGDVGRGFAVVAEEVRRLAERSVDSIREIGRVIETVQRDTSQAVDLTDSVLTQIVDSVTRTSSLVTEVHSATEEQSRGAAQIVTTTGTMQDITQQLATSSREQSASAEAILQAVEHMNRMTQQVADATREQKRGGDLVVKSTEQITDVARQNLSASAQLTTTTVSLVEEAETLRKLSQRFEV